MPTENHFAGMDLSEILIEIAEHHSKKSTRHITQFEKQCLYKAAKKLRAMKQS
jgi:hypothetical protein